MPLQSLMGLSEGQQKLLIWLGKWLGSKAMIQEEGKKGMPFTFCLIFFTSVPLSQWGKEAQVTMQRNAICTTRHYRKVWKWHFVQLQCMYHTIWFSKS